MVDVSRKSRQHALRVSLLLAALMVTALLSGCGLMGGGQKPLIRLYDGQWESLWVSNAIVEFIVEEGYGYPVETVVQTAPVMQDAIQKGEIDLNMEAWQQNWIDWYNEQTETGNIVNLGMTYEAGPQFFMIPRWVAEQYGIKTILDMQAQWELFRDPAAPSKGTFYNCIIGWDCAEVNLIKLEAYGLTPYYNVISPGSSAALEAVLARAQTNGQPVFGYYWAPGALLGAYGWHVLEEPPYTEQCWERITAARQDKSLRPLDQACAYEAAPVDKVAHQGLLEKAPDVVEMLSNMVVGLEPLNKTLAWATENEVQDWHQVGVYYLRSYEERWETWVTPEVYTRVKQALGKVTP